MLFYIKKYIGLEIFATFVLGAIGWLGIQYYAIPIRFEFNLKEVLLGFAGALILTAWTFLVQTAYGFFRGKEFAAQMTHALAKVFFKASVFQIVLGGLLAAFGEEVFFRGFIQNKWGIVTSALMFAILHFGKKDIRIVSYWAFAHGLIIAFSYHLTNNLLTPMLTHGLFDLGAMFYFRMYVNKQP